MIRAGLAAVVLAMAALLALRAYDPSRPAEPPAPETPGDSDYYLLDAEIRQTDVTGALQYRIKTDESLHYPDDSIRLSGLDVLHVGGESGPWRLTAPRGRVPAGSRDIRLDGGVTLQQERDDGNGLRLTMPYAWIRPEEDRVDTEATVEAAAPGRSLRGTGMTAWLNLDRLRLSHDVRVIYAP